MSSSIFPNSDSYSYEDLNRYFETIEETPSSTDQILDYVKHLIQEQPNLQKFHDLENTLSHRMKQVSDGTALASLASQVSALMHQEMPTSLVTHAGRNPAFVIEILEKESDKTVIFNTLLRLAPLRPGQVAKAISLFKHLTQHQRLSLAEACLLADPLLIPKRINLFEIADEKNTLAMFKKIFSSNWDILCQIDSINLSQEGLKELFIYCAQENPRLLILQYNALKIQDSQFAEQVFLLAQRYPELIFRFYRNFELSPDLNQALIRTSLHHSADRSGMIAEFIQHAQDSEAGLIRFIEGEQDGELLQTLAFGCAKQFPRFLVKHLKKFKIQDQKVLEQLARTLAEGSGELLSHCIQDFKIENPQVRLELAQQVIPSCFQTDKVKRFDLEKEEDRLDLAIRWIQSPQLTELSIEKLGQFEIHDPKHLLKLAAVAMQRFPVEIAQQIEFFGSQSQEDLFTLAQAAVVKSKGLAIKYIHLFRLATSAYRIAIAELAADLNGEQTASCMKRLEISDPEVLFHLAVRCAKNNGNTIDHLDAFQMKEEVKRLQIALICAKTAPKIVIENMDLVGLNDEINRFKLASACAEVGPAIVAQKIKVFKLNAEHRLMIAWLCIGPDLPEHFKQFEIADPTQRIELAKKCAKKYPRTVAEFIAEFQIEDKGIEFECLKQWLQASKFPLVVLQKIWPTLSLAQQIEITNFLFAYDPHKLMMAFEFIKMDKALTIDFLRRYALIPDAKVPNISYENIQEAGIRLELAMLYATHHPAGFAPMVDYFDIPDEAERFELAKRCFQADPSSIPKNIARFALSPTHVFELAKECAKNPKSRFLDAFRQFDLKDAHQVAEVAFLSAQYNGSDTIHQFGTLKIKNLDDRLRVIRACAQSAPKEVYRLINPANIPSEEERLTLAKTCMVESETSILYLRQFGIQSAIDNQELVNLYASHYPEQFQQACSQIIDPLFIPNEEERKRLAIIGCETNPHEAIHFIHYFGIHDHPFLIGLITKMATKIEFGYVNPLFSIDWTEEEASQLFQMLRLTQKNMSVTRLSEEAFSACYEALKGWGNTPLALLVIQSYYPQIREFLCQHPNIIPVDQLPPVTQKLSVATAKICAIAYLGLKAISREKLTTPFQEKELETAIMKMIIEGATIEPVFAVIRSHYPIIRDFLSGYPSCVKVDQLPAVDAPLSKAQMKMYATTYLGLKLLPREKLETKQIDEQDLKIETIKEKLWSLTLANDLFKKIMSHRNPSQALFYIRLLAYESSPEMMQALKIGVQKELKAGSQEAYGKPLAPLLIPMLVVAEWGAECHHPELLSDLNKIFRNRKVRDQYFKAEAASSDSMVQVWLQTVDLLDEVKELSAERKIKLLTQAATSKPEPMTQSAEPESITKLRDRLLSIQGVIFSDAVQQLNRDFSSSIDSDLKAIILEGLISDNYLDLKNVDSLEEKYMKTLAALRYPNGWKIYEQRLQKTGEEKVQQAYQRFIVSVLNGTFREERYQTTSPHIALIRGKYESIWQQWQLEDQGKMVNVNGIDYQVKVTDDWQDLLLSGTEVAGSCQRIDGDSNLNKGLQAYLLDGKIRMVVIKVAENGQIYARALLRLMWDEQTQSPVLFLDRKYPEQLSEEASVALDEYAIAYAKQIGCSLYSYTPYHEELPIHHPLVSMGSCTPYEYADSAFISDAEEQRLTPDGKYHIHEVYPIWIAL